MIKKYGVRNTSECVFKFKIGKANITCRFTNGNLQSREPIPASYITDNPIVQHVIESCEKFKNNHIYIIWEEDNTPKKEEAPVVETPAPAPAKKTTRKKVAVEGAEVKVMEDVTTHGAAVDALMAAGEYGLQDLATVESCKAKAAEIGISFPNLK